MEKPNQGRLINRLRQWQDFGGRLKLEHVEDRRVSGVNEKRMFALLGVDPGGGEVLGENLGLGKPIFSYIEKPPAA